MLTAFGDGTNNSMKFQAEYNRSSTNPEFKEDFAMIERTIDLPTPSGPMETFIVHPQDGGPHPAVVLYMDVWGIREELRDIA